MHTRTSTRVLPALAGTILSACAGDSPTSPARVPDGSLRRDYTSAYCGVNPCVLFQIQGITYGPGGEIRRPTCTEASVSETLFEYDPKMQEYRQIHQFQKHCYGAPGAGGDYGGGQATFFLSYPDGTTAGMGPGIEITWKTEVQYYSVPASASVHLSALSYGIDPTNGQKRCRFLAWRGTPVAGALTDSNLVVSAASLAGAHIVAEAQCGLSRSTGGGPTDPPPECPPEVIDCQPSFSRAGTKNALQ